MKKHEPTKKDQDEGSSSQNKIDVPTQMPGLSTPGHDAGENELLMQNEEMREKYRLLFDLAPVACITFDRDGYVRDVNLAAAQLLGMEKHLLLNRPFSPFVQQDNLPDFRNHVAKAFHTRSLETCTILMKTKDGTELLAEFRSRVAQGHSEAAGFCSTAIISQGVNLQLGQELRAREEEFHSMVELFAVGKAQVDPGTCRFVRVNQRFCTITGYTEPELLSMTFDELTHPEDRGRTRECYERALRREAPVWKAEKRYVRKDGAVIWVKITGMVMFDTSGTAYRSMAVVEDITESKSAEQSLRESEERYRSLVESLPEGIFVQQERVCVYVNRAGLELLQAKNSDEVLGKKVIDFIHPEFREKAEKRIQQIEEEGHNFVPRELRILRLDGQQVDVEAISTPIMFGGRRAVQILIKDITDRWQSELRLRLQATVLSQVNDAVVAVGLDGHIIFWNRGAERLYKVCADEAIGKRRDAVYRYRWPAPEQGDVVRDGGAGSHFLRGENVHVLWNGEEIHVESSVSLLLSWSGLPAGWLAVMRDITERKVFEQKLKESEERYRSLVESSPDVITVYQDDKIVYANPATRRLLRAAHVNDIVSKNASRFFRSDFLASLNEGMVAAEKNRIPARETEVLRLDGSSVHVESVGTPIRYGGRPAIQIIAKDITERKQFEEALRNSEQTYRLMFESNPHPMWFYDPDTLRFQSVNEAAIAHYGYTRDEFLSMTLKDIRPAEDFPNLFDNVARIAEGRHDSGIWRHRKKDGTTIDVEIISHGLKLNGKDARVVLAHDITGRKKAEDALRESQQAYRTLAENLPGIVYRVFCRENNRIQFFNRSASAIIGYSAEELSGGRICSLEELILPEDRSEVVAAVSKAMDEKKSFIVEYRLRSRDGEIHYLMEQGRPVFDVKGVILYIDGVISDVTERKYAEQAVKEARDAAERERQHLEIILNTIPSGVFVAEAPLGVITLQNKQAREILGRDMSGESMLTPEYIAKYELRRSDGQFFLVDELPYFRALAGEQVTDLEMTTRRPDGTVITILSNAAPVRNSGGTIAGSVAAFTDITERKRAEDDLKRARIELELRVKERTGELAATIDALQGEIAERRRTAAERDKLVAAVESAAEAIVVTDRIGIIQYVNPAFEQVTGYRRQEVLGGNVHIFDSGQHDQEFFRQMRETIRTEGVWKGRLINKKKDGTIYYEDCTYSPVKDASGNVVNFVSIKHDVTEKLRLESIAETVDAMNNIGYVFSGIRHEIGNPVSSLLIIMSLLKKKYETSPREAIGEYIDQAVSQVERIEYLLTSLKSFNMYENLQIRSIDALSFFEKFVSLIASDLSKKGVLLQSSMPPKDCFVAADPRALQQALLNIVINASDAMDGRHDAMISLAVMLTGAMIRIRVSDNGAGISEERKKDLFKPFYTTKAHGTGLGLVISRKLVSRMKGFIEITSQIGTGTSVDIYLPEGSSERTIEQKKDSPGH